MRLRSVLAAAALVSASLVARADTYTVLDLNSAFQVLNSTGDVTGTLTLDDTTDTFTSADLNATGFGFLNSTLDVIAGQGQTGGRNSVEQVTIVNSSDTAGLDLVLPVQTLAGYTGGDICTDSSNCRSQVTDYDLIFTAKSGSLMPDIAPTPEPSSLLLIGTGLLGMAGVVRRKIQAGSLA